MKLKSVSGSKSSVNEILGTEVGNEIFTYTNSKGWG